VREWLRNNPLWVDKQRVQDKPAAEDVETGQGGSDVELTRAVAAVDEAEAEQNPYVPPLPVPIARTIRRDYTYQRGLRSAVWLARSTSNSLPRIGTLNTGEPADAGEDFPINSIMVDNFTALWASWPEVGVWVPPFVFGKVFRFDGSRRKRVLFEMPPGLATPTSPTTITGTQLLRATFYEELLPETPGLSLPTTDR
jgi:hypothetical protein